MEKKTAKTSKAAHKLQQQDSIANFTNPETTRKEKINEHLEMIETNHETVLEIQNILFHIQSMGMLLISHHTELIDTKQLSPDPQYQSEPILAIADIIKEKTDICLNKMRVLEEHFFEEWKKLAS